MNRIPMRWADGCGAVSGPPTGTGYPVVYEYGQVLDTTQNVADAALIALTPEIAEWAADAYALLSDLSWNHMSVSRAALVDRFEEIGSDGKAAA